jgi:hypothetical protein
VDDSLADQQRWYDERRARNERAEDDRDRLIVALRDVRVSLSERIRALCDKAGACGEAGCTSVATCDLLRVLDEETAR